MKGAELLLLNTLTFVKELAINAEHHGQSAALSKIIREIDQTRAAYDHLQTAEGSPPPTSGNAVELRTVGKHKWLFINGVHVAQVVESSLLLSAGVGPRFAVTFGVDGITGFDF